MWKYLNKGISTPIAIMIILVLSIAVGAFVFWQSWEIQKEEIMISEIVKSKENTTLKESETSLESICLTTGGKVFASFCCKTAQDFPNSCLIGACGCSPENSKEVKTCDCGPEKCFDGNGCRQREKL
jgi:hypothetical protein